MPQGTGQAPSPTPDDSFNIFDAVTGKGDNEFKDANTPEDEENIFNQAAGKGQWFEPPSYPYPGFTKTNPKGLADDGYHYLASGLRRNANSEYEVKKRDTNKWIPMPAGTKLLLNKLAANIEDSYHGLGVGVGMAVGAGQGRKFGPGMEWLFSTGGGAFGGFAADVIQSLATGKDKETSDHVMTALSDAAISGVFAGIPRVADGLESKFKANALGAAQEGSSNAAAAELGNTANEFGVKLRSDQQNPNNLSIANKVQTAVDRDPQAAQRIQAEQDRSLVDKFKLLPDVETANENPHFSASNRFKEIQKKHEEEMHDLVNEAMEAAPAAEEDAAQVFEKMKIAARNFATIDEQGNVLAKDTSTEARLFKNQLQRLKGWMRGSKPQYGNRIADYADPDKSHFVPQNPEDLTTMGTSAPAETSYRPGNDYGGPYVDPFEKAKAVNARNLPLGMQTPSEAGHVNGGINLGQTMKMLEDVRGFANFEEERPSIAEKAWRKIYNDIAGFRDNLTESIFNDPRSGIYGQINNDRLQNLRRGYSTHIGDMEDIRRAIKHNPAQAGAVLLDPKDPALARKALTLADPDSRAIMRGQLLNSLLEPNSIKPSSVSDAAFVSGSKIVKAWNKMKAEKPFIEAVFDDKEIAYIDKFINLARAIENRRIEVDSIKDNPLVKEMVGHLIKPTEISMSMRFANSLVRRMITNKSIADYIENRVYPIYKWPASRHAGIAKGLGEVRLHRIAGGPFKGKQIRPSRLAGQVGAAAATQQVEKSRDDE